MTLRAGKHRPHGLWETFCDFEQSLACQHIIAYDADDGAIPCSIEFGIGVYSRASMKIHFRRIRQAGYKLCVFAVQSFMNGETLFAITVV